MRTFVAGVGAVAVVGAALAGCGAPLTVSKDALQTDISDRLTKAGKPPQSVTCKDDLVGEPGRVTRCEVVLGANNSFEPVITVTGTDGATVNYEMKPALSREQLQNSVSTLVQQGTGVPVNSVECESGLEGSEGTEAFCWVDAGGVTVRRTVEVTSVRGLLMNYNVVPLLTKAEVESSLLDQLEHQLGQRPDSAACTDNLEGRPGKAIDCLVVAGGESQTFAVTVTTVNNGNINYTYAPKA